jgi:hypothetical protein
MPSLVLIHLRHVSILLSGEEMNGPNGSYSFVLVTVNVRTQKPFIFIDGPTRFYHSVHHPCNHFECMRKG